MKALIITTGSILLLCLTINARLTAAEHTGAPEAAAAPLSGMVESSEVQADTHFVLKEYHQKVAVFSSDSKTPVYISETPVTILPAADQERLQSGIITATRSEMLRCLEELCS